MRSAPWTIVLFASLLVTASAVAQYGPPPISPYRGPVDSRGRMQRNQRGNDVEEFAKRLESRDPRDRIEAVQDLGQSADNRAVDYLLKAVGDDDPRVQVRAVDFLGDRRSTDAAPLLVQKLFLSDSPQLLRQHLLAALGKIGDPRSTRPILDFVAQEPNPDARGTAIYTLGEIGDIGIREDLAKLRETERDPRVQKITDDALAKLGMTARPKTDLFVPPSSNVVPPVR